MTQLLETCYLSWDAEDRHAILYCHTPARAVTWSRY